MEEEVYVVDDDYLNMCLLMRNIILYWMVYWAYAKVLFTLFSTMTTCKCSYFVWCLDENYALNQFEEVSQNNLNFHIFE